MERIVLCVGGFWCRNPFQLQTSTQNDAFFNFGVRVEMVQSFDFGLLHILALTFQSSLGAMSVPVAILYSLRGDSLEIFQWIGQPTGGVGEFWRFGVTQRDLNPKFWAD